MGHFNDRPRQKRKGFKKSDKTIAQCCASKKFLKGPSSVQALGKTVLPLHCILFFHLLAGDVSLQKLPDEGRTDLSCLQGNAHSVSAKGSDHAGRISQHETVIFHLGFLLEIDLRDRDGKRFQKTAFQKNLL